MKLLLSISFTLLFLLPAIAFAKIRDFETTRMMSLSGAGVGAVLVNEASFLNPASIAFYDDSALYYQRNTSKVETQDPSRLTNQNNFKEGDFETLVISDTNAAYRGTFSYQRQNENSFKRTRYTSSLSTLLAPRHAIGVLYRYTMDNTPSDHSDIFHQFNFGYTYIESKKFSFGLILVDPFQKRKNDTKVVAGINYELFYNFFLLADYGTYYAFEAKNNTVSSYGIQLSLLKNIFVRIGQSYNQFNNEKSQSWGFSWVGPRMSLEYAYKSTELISKTSDYLINDENMIEQSLALSVRF